MASKIIILSAPSGSGKTTIASEILNDPVLRCSFSVSATSRPPRSHETDGIHYYFLSPEQFLQNINDNKFIEWEEVYEGQYYGTLRSEIEKLSSQGKNIVFDVDVKGGIRLKNIFGKEAISIFIMPPSLEELQKRLRNRNTENEESLQKRIHRASDELLFADQFDVVVINDHLHKAIEEVRKHITQFTNPPDDK